MSKAALTASFAAICMSVTMAAAAERPMVNVECKPTSEKMVYHCMFNVMGKKSHQPIEAAEFKVNADMTSMPMAHNVKPIQPKPVADKPGMYSGTLNLEMMGEWTLKMEFKQPVRDVVIEKVMFGDQAMDHSNHGDNTMDHSSHGTKSE